MSKTKEQAARILEAGRQDAMAVYKIDRACFEINYTLEEIDDWLNIGSIRAMIAYVNLKPVGYIMWHSKSRSIALIRVAVMPRYRRRGIGTQLMGMAKGVLRSYDRRYASAVVSDLWTNAHTFLLSIGFVASSEVIKTRFRDHYLFIYRPKHSTRHLAKSA